MISQEEHHKAATLDALRSHIETEITKEHEVARKVGQKDLTTFQKGRVSFAHHLLAFIDLKMERTHV